MNGAKRPNAEEIIEAGLTAQHLDPQIVAVCSERTQAIVRDLVNSYKAHDLTTERLWAAVGALNELAELPAANARRVTAMHREREKQMRGQRAD